MRPCTRRHTRCSHPAIPIEGQVMSHLLVTQDDGFDRLQRLLLAMRPGDELLLSDAVRLTGLTESICTAMLQGLARAGLMSCEADRRFVRRSLDFALS